MYSVFTTHHLGREELVMEPALILAYVLIVAGLFLLAAELFMPSGTFLVLSLAAIVIGVAMTFLKSDDPTRGIVTLICVFAAVPLVGGVVLHYWPTTRIGRR